MQSLTKAKESMQETENLELKENPILFETEEERKRPDDYSYFWQQRKLIKKFNHKFLSISMLQMMEEFILVNIALF